MIDDARSQAIGTAHATPDPFGRVWDAFLSGGQTADGRHDTPYWRAHEGPYAACIVRVPADVLQPDLNALRGELERLDGVRLHPDYFLHIMLQELGFIVEHPTRPDELTPARLEEFAQAAVGAVASMAPAAVSVGGVNSFEDAVFLEVHPGATLRAMHERLFDLAAIPYVPAYPYLPHCTIAHYDGSVPAAAARTVLEPWRDAICGEFEIVEIEVVTLDTTTPYPELESYAVIPIDS